MNLILFINKHIQKSWSKTRLKKLRCRSNLLNDLPGTLVSKIPHSACIFRECVCFFRLWTRCWGWCKGYRHTLSVLQGPSTKCESVPRLIWALKSWTNLLFIAVINGSRKKKAGLRTTEWWRWCFYAGWSEKVSLGGDTWVDTGRKWFQKVLQSSFFILGLLYQRIWYIKSLNSLKEPQVFPY